MGCSIVFFFFFLLLFLMTSGGQRPLVGGEAVCEGVADDSESLQRGHVGFAG